MLSILGVSLSYFVLYCTICNLISAVQLFTMQSSSSLQHTYTRKLLVTGRVVVAFRFLSVTA